jgi:arylsulfatase A-like enzyme
MERGYILLVSADHGMNVDGLHGGTTPEVREVPLFVIQPGIAGKGDSGTTISQLQIAPTICKLLGIPVPETMKAAALV